MNPFFIVDDESLVYNGQVATLIVRETVGNGLSMYRCRMDDGRILSFLAYQLGNSYLTRSEADAAALNGKDRIL